MSRWTMTSSGLTLNDFTRKFPYFPPLFLLNGGEFRANLKEFAGMIKRTLVSVSKAQSFPFDQVKCVTQST